MMAADKGANTDHSGVETPTYIGRDVGEPASGVYQQGPGGADGRYPYDGKGSYRSPNGDWFPARKYKNVLLSVTMTILVMECTERLCFYGIIGSIQTYLINYFHYSRSQASALTSTVTTVVYFTPLLGAYLADVRWGRFRTILYMGIIYLVGVILISITTYPSIESKVPFLIGLYGLVGIGAGGIKPNVVTFGADQFDITTPEGQKEQQRFFNFFYWVINVGAFFSYSVLAQMATNGMGAIPDTYGFFASFTISAAAWVIAIIAFLVGSPRYIKLAPSGTVLPDFLKLFALTARKTVKGCIVFVSMILIVIAVVLSCVTSFMDQNKPLTYFTGVLFVIGFFAVVLLNRDPSYVLEAAKKDGNSGRINAQEAVDAYKFLRVWSPVFFAVLFWVVYNQMSSNMYSIACQCNLFVYGNTQLNGSFLNLGDTLAIVIFIPIMEAFGYPMIERLKGSKFTSLQKMFWGMVCAFLAMISTAIIEIVRKKQSLLDDRDFSKCASDGVYMSNFSVWWMAIPYMLIGLAEVLISVPLYELSYVEVPEGVRSTAQALNLFTTSISGGVSAIIPLIFSSWLTDNLNDGKMENLFWVLSALSAFGAVFFVYVVKDFQYADVVEIHTQGLESQKLAVDSLYRKDSYEGRISLSRRSFASGSNK